MKAVSLSAVHLMWLLPLLTGCSESATDLSPIQASYDQTVRQDSTEREAVFETLHTLNQTALRTAFDRLPQYYYTRYARTEQFDVTSQRTASSERITRHSNEAGSRAQSILHAEATGAFDLDRVDTVGMSEHHVARLPQYLLPDDPAYLMPRNQEHFSYRFLPDTTWWNRPTQVIEIRALPGTPQALRHIRLYVDRADNELIALYFERTEGGGLFREESRFSFQIRPAPDDGWVPYTTRFLTQMRVPLRALRQFRAVSTYYGFAPIE